MPPNLNRVIRLDSIPLPEAYFTSEGYLIGLLQDNRKQRLQNRRTRQGSRVSGTGQHTLGRAADIVCYSKDGKIIPAEKVCCTLEDMGGIYGIGYISQNAVHVDTRSKSTK